MIYTVILSFFSPYFYKMENSKYELFKASSPDEVALVEWTATVGLKLTNRTLKHITLTGPDGSTLGYEILKMFPFTSESKRMGIILRDQNTGQIVFYMKVTFEHNLRFPDLATKQ